MKFVELTPLEFDTFATKHPQKNYVQTSKMAELKQLQGNKIYLVGIKKNNRIVAATMMFAIPTHFNKNIFYAPRGFLIDYHDYDLLQIFTKEVKKFIKKRNGISLIIDPKEPYQILDGEGNIKSKQNKLSVNNLKKCGYIHFGFNKYFETIQVRYSAIIPVKESYEEMLQTFTKSTRKHLLDLKDSTIKVRKGTKNDLQIMENLFKYTAENKHFEYKSLDYYEKMYQVMPELMNIYIAYIDFDDESNMLKHQLEEAKKEQQELEIYMQKINVGSKMLQKQKILENKIKKLEENISLNKENKEKYGKLLNVGSLLSIESGDEYISLTSGMLQEFKHYNPKYAMYNEHIKDAIKKKKKIVNFYGIAGDFNPSNELYKIYELKKGFNCDIVELIGQFNLPITNMYYLYKLGLQLKKITKKYHF